MNERALEKLAYLLWEARGRPEGSPDADWLHAETLVNEASLARANEDPEFFHCFTRSTNPEDSFETLKLMLDIGLLLIPERLQFYPDPVVTQTRLSLALIHPTEVRHLSATFGPFVLRMAPYERIAGEFGASPVWYVPSYIKNEEDSQDFRFGQEVADALAKTQRWIHDMRNDPARQAQRHEPHRTTRLALRLMYPTHHREDTELHRLHFMQREWRIVKRDSPLDRCVPLVASEAQRVRDRSPTFFDAKIPVWSDSAGAMVEVPRVAACRKIDANFSDLVEEILVPESFIDRVNRLSPGVPVSPIEQRQYGY